MQPSEAFVAPIVNSALYPYKVLSSLFKVLSSLFKHTTYDPAALPTNDNDADPVFRIPSASRTHDGCEEHAPSKTLALTGAAAASNITVAAAGIAIDTANDKSDDVDDAPSQQRSWLQCPDSWSLPRLAPSAAVVAYLFSMSM